MKKNILKRVLTLALAALLAKGAVPEDLGEAAGPERLRDLLRALEPVSRNKM